jgi:hypothetical protein
MEDEEYSIENPPCITSQTITHLTIKVTDPSANTCLFDTVYNSTMHGLKDLCLQVEADEDQNCCGESSEQQMRKFDWHQRYPSLTSVHLIVASWPFQDDPHEGVPQDMMDTIQGSRFLHWCLDARILIVESHECDHDNINQGREPDAEWTSVDGSLVRI